MIKDNFAYIANYLWRESIRNINNTLTESEAKSFSANDYYYLTTIYYLQKPNFSQLTETLGLTKPAISAIVRKLVHLDLVVKEQSEEDRRIYFVTPTEKGIKIVEGDENLYGNFELLLRKLTSTEEQYSFIDNLIKNIVKELK